MYYIHISMYSNVFMYKFICIVSVFLYVLQPICIHLRQKVNIAIDDESHERTGWSTKVYIYLLHMRYICWGRYRGVYIYLMRY